jgi:hypothetical protein
MNKTGIKQFQTVFLEGDDVVLTRGTYEGAPGIFLRLRVDPKWADITERNGIVRSHPLEWLARSSRAGQ